MERTHSLYVYLGYVFIFFPWYSCTGANSKGWRSGLERTVTCYSEIASSRLLEKKLCTEASGKDAFIMSLHLTLDMFQSYRMI